MGYHGAIIGDFNDMKNDLQQQVLILIFKPSITIMNKKDKKGSPCWTPSVFRNSKVGERFNETEAPTGERHPLVHFLYLEPKPICSMNESTKPHSMESNAFSKSTVNRNIWFLTFHLKNKVRL